ncbi:MAG: GGDEF domain-containing protein [Gammaproteobacteria bacterium]|nr:GGDEF domain-containing protein [Gammaproteobacteria bacterium]
MLTSKDKKNTSIFVYYLLASTLVFSILTLIHSWITFNQVQIIHFLIPVFASTVVGYLLAHNKILQLELIQLANTDKLTGACNRLYFDERLKQEIDRARRYKQFFSIIYLDIDHFKRVNDKFGHGTGDEVLKSFSKIVKSQNRESDIFARFGGEEFIILTQMADKASAYNLYERIKKAVKDYEYKPSEKITFSAGIAEFDIEEDSIQSILERADKALYKAKEEGRNRAVIAD